MTQFLPRDPLLTTTTVLLWISFGLLAFAAVVLAFTAPAILIGATLPIIDIDGIRPRLIATDLPLVAALTAAAFVLVSLALVFIRKLILIVASVRLSDPLTDANASRLQTMGWCALAIQFAGVAMKALTLRLPALIDPAKIELGFNGSGILLILLLFVLARVFRIGAAMRRDLEGTV